MADSLFEMIVGGCAKTLELLEEEGTNDEQLRKAAELYLVTAAFTYCEISHRFQGEQVYIQKKPQNKQLKIQNAFNGNNIDELINTFDVSRATIYRAVAKKNGEHQPDIIDEIVNGIFRRKSVPNLSATEFKDIKYQ